MISKLNLEIEGMTDLGRTSVPIKSNVAIASAVTSYAWMYMHQFKDNKVFYSDTDSIITSKPLSKKWLNSEIGSLKNELAGVAVDGKITKAYFLGLKNYAYQYIDINTNQTITCSVWAGVPRNSLTWEQIEILANGGTIKIFRKGQFIQSLMNLRVYIKDTSLTIKANIDKILEDNRYISKDIFVKGKPINENNKRLYAKLLKQVIKQGASAHKDRHSRHQRL